MVNDSRQRGFVLMDVLIAFLILSIALLSIALMHTNATKNTAEAWQHTVATGLASEQLNRLKTFNQSQWASVGNTVAWQGGGAVSNVVTLDGVAYTVATTISTPTEPGSTNLREAQVTVSWTNSGRAKTVVMTGLYNRNNT